MSLSASEKVLAANWKLNAVPACASWAAIAFATVGALLAATAMSKVSLAVPSLPSSAVTFTENVAAVVGVPEKVRVLAVKVSQSGSASSL